MIQLAPRINNLNIESLCELPSPLSIRSELPLTDPLAGFVASGRRAVREILDDDDGEPGSRAKHLRTLSQTLLALSNSAKDEKIADLRRKLDEKDRVIADLKARIAELEAQIAAENSDHRSATGISREKLAEVEEQIKLL